MFNKYSARSLPSVYIDNTTTQPSSQKEPSWYKEFISNLEKNSLESHQSIYDDINAILGNTKSKYSSVEEAVQDLKERTGLSAFLKTIQANVKEPEIFQQIPEMKTFIDNYVQDRPGTSIESVVHDLLKIDGVRYKLINKDDVDDDVRHYINDKIVECKDTDYNEVNMNIGKVDPTAEEISNDPLSICEPHK